MRRLVPLLAGFAGVSLIVASLLAVDREPPERVVAVVPSTPYVTVMQSYTDWRAEQDAARVEAERLAAEEAAEAARVEELNRSSRRIESAYPSSGGFCPGDWGPVDGYTIWRESRCDPGAYNATGCGGRGCIGAYQLDQGHFYDTSPWNSNVPGSCADLDPNTEAGQRECAGRLGPDAWR